MSEPTESDPVSGIRAVFLAGFLTGGVCGLLYLAIKGHLWESVSPNPLALIGAFLGVGLVGAMIGGAFGLSLKLLLDRQKRTAGWLAPIIVAGAISAAIGMFITYILVAVLWSD